MQGAAVSPAAATAYARQGAGARRLRIAVAERRALLALGDIVALNLGLYITVHFVELPRWLTIVYPTIPIEWTWFAVLTALWLAIAALTDSFDLALAGKRFGSAYRAATVGTVVLVAYLLTPVVTPPLLKSRLMWLVLAAISLTLLAAWRYLYALLMGHPVLSHRALIVGAGEGGRLVVEAMREQPGSGYLALGFVDDDPRLHDAPVASLPVLGGTDRLPEFVEAMKADEVIVAVSGTLRPNAYRAIEAAYEAGVRVTPMVQVYEELMERIPVAFVGDLWLSVLPQSVSGASHAVTKRLVDVCGGLLGLALTALALVPVGLAILVDSGWPVLYVQERIGRRGKPFRIYKFRTVATEHSGGTGTIWENKVRRPTRVGRLLRMARLDELPQFWNVLRGDMSLVGPRPFVREEIEELQRYIPFFRSRLLVRPGLTGWAQIKGVYGTSLEDEREKLEYDLYYIRHQSIGLDLFILFKTVAVVLRLAGR